MAEAKRTELIERTGSTPNTVTSLVHELRRLGIRPGSTVLVHSSLSALGWVAGGAVAVIEALIRVLEDSGTLVMPTHSADLSDPLHWTNPPVPEAWWPIVRESMPPFDPKKTPTRGMGRVPELFRNYPGVVRSGHPQLSFAAVGPRAAEITASHSLEHGLGEESPLARLYEMDAQVLLLGATHASNTSLHLAEYRAEYPTKRVRIDGAPILVDGERIWVEIQDLEFEPDDFSEVGQEFIATGAVREGTVGLARAQIMSQPRLVDFAVTWMEARRR